MVAELEKKTAVIQVIGQLAEGMRVDGLDVSFWTSVVEPVAFVIIKAGASLTASEQALLMSIATKAVRSAAHDARTSGVVVPLVGGARGAA